MKPLFLCYDHSRFPQARALAITGKKPIIIFNPNDGIFGPPSFLSPWIELMHFCASKGALSFGYIDLLDSNSKPKTYNQITEEIISWDRAGVTKIFLDDARASAAPLIRKLSLSFKSHLFLANPGTYCPSLRGIPSVLLIEQEDNSEKLKLLSSISIIFCHPENLKALTASASRLLYCAFEPISTYHQPSEYQLPNPFYPQK